jgi:hypothetical protein
MLYIIWDDAQIVVMWERNRLVKLAVIAKTHISGKKKYIRVLSVMEYFINNLYNKTFIPQ